MRLAASDKASPPPVPPTAEVPPPMAPPTERIEVVRPRPLQQRHMIGSSLINNSPPRTDNGRPLSKKLVW